MSKYFAKYKLPNGVWKLEHFDTLPREVLYVSGYANPTMKGRAFIKRTTNKGSDLVPLFNSKTQRQHKKSR